jgi:hypothetical protein
LLLLYASASPALAQAQVSDLPPVSFYAGYTSLRTNANPGQCGCFFMSGGTSELDLPASNHWSVVGDVSGASVGSVNGSNTGLAFITYTSGPRYTQRFGRFSTFAHALVGGTHGFSSYFPNKGASADAVAFLTGGGLDLRVGDVLSLRPFQADYLYTGLPNSTVNRQNNLRLSAGVLLRLHAPAHGY